MIRILPIFAALALAAALPASADDPADAAPKAAPAKKAAKKADAKAPESTDKMKPVGSLGSTPERKLGEAREPCVYKPVMTQEDLDNCK